MKIKIAFLLALCLMACSVSVYSQAKPLLKRTTYKTDRLDFGAGGTVDITGAPVGSIRIEGWKNREIEISAEIEVNANTEADLAKLSEVTTFGLEESLGRLGIYSVGVHDKKYVKRMGKKFPKELASMPFRIDYVIKVPQYCDLQIDGGQGDLSISNVEGVMKLSFLDTNAKLDLVGGIIQGVFGKGKVELVVPSVSWRGRSLDVQLASGEMNVRLPAGVNADVDATILRSGKIENTFTGLKPRSRTGVFTDKSILAKSGIGGVQLKFTVGDGDLKISSLESHL